MKRLASEGYRVTPHWKIGTFRIDLVVEGTVNRLAHRIATENRYHSLEKLQKTRTGSPCWNAWVGSSRAFAARSFPQSGSRDETCFGKVADAGDPPTAASADAEPARQTAHDAVDRVIPSRGGAS